MKGVAIGTIAVAGLGLFGTGVHGLAQVDGKLADAAERPAVKQVRDESRAKGDCPKPARQHRSYERRQL
ncbi:MAG TPA: hypothetical protein VGW14_01410 [Thermoleophilaceae bacterium]|nr:hypothetical protein [Thermoleophilaceae bacterium]